MLPRTSKLGFPLMLLFFLSYTLVAKQDRSRLPPPGQDRRDLDNVLGGNQPQTTPSNGGSTAGSAPPPSKAPDVARPHGAPASAGADYLLFTQYRRYLLALLRNPGVIEKISVPFANTQILGEQIVWNEFYGSLKMGKPILLDEPKVPVVQYQWQDALVSNPPLAEGPLLDVFLRPQADWSFLKSNPAWDGKPSTYVAGFVFSKDKIAGRDPEFAAREQKAVVERQLALASKRSSTHFWFTVDLPVWQYDGKAIRFLEKGAYRLANGTSKPAEHTSLLNPAPWVLHQLPGKQQEASLCAVYSLNVNVRQVQEDKPGAFSKVLSPTTYWRERSFAAVGGMVPGVEALAFDRELDLESVPYESREAERLSKENRKLQARVYFDAGDWTAVVPYRVDSPPRAAAPARQNSMAKERGLVFAKLRQIDIMTSDGEFVAAIQPQTLPPPQAAGSAPGTAGVHGGAAADSSAASSAKTSQEAREQRRRDQQASQQQRIADFQAARKPELQKQIAKNKRTNDCRTRARRVNRDITSTEFKTEFDSCMAETNPDR